ncbi:membrane-anchored junction protein isoform X3 [Hemicordylus capensis]|uniref:membrane-anchored junction protein isoform X3 n=1 Tax=Hemicordylus capensis TaxID=884348 RepID=UPI0023026C61|nr:membrane-anchored junction protein isoform X3 [Hemicordylus capensis]
MLLSSSFLTPKSWNSEHTSLKAFTYPMPETRFFHVGKDVYKFKIKYGNTISASIDFHESVVNEELEEAIRVILGNLKNLHPFTTEHLVIFPYLNRWERVSDLRFKHGDTFLIPYPYVCSMYVELNSWQQNVFWGKADHGDICNSANSRDNLKTMDTARASKWRSLEDTVAISHSQQHVDRYVAKNATCIYDATKPKVGRVRLQNDMIHPTQNQPEEIQYQYCRTTTNSGYDNQSLLGEHVQHVRTDNSRQEGQEPIPPERAEENVELKNRGFLELLKSTLLPPLLQRIFSGSSQAP